MKNDDKNELSRKKLREEIMASIPDDGALRIEFENNNKTLAPKKREKKWAESKNELASFLESRMTKEPDVAPRGKAR